MNRLTLFISLCKAKRSARLSADSVKAMQQKRLRKLLHYTYRNSDYYKTRFSDCGITEDKLDSIPLSDFPCIDKAVLIENFDSLVTKNGITQAALLQFDEQRKNRNELFQSKYHIVHSSGSTGKPGYFLYDRSAWETMLVGIIRAALWDLSVFGIIRLLISRPRILYVAATDGLYGGTMAVGDGVAGLGIQQLHLDVNTPLEKWIAQINEFKPDIVIGYPSAVKILVELAAEGRMNVRLRRIITCGEPLGANQRHFFESKTGAKVLNFYGAGESIALGVEDNAADGMILFDDMNIIEAENGSMYLTSLYNYAQPLIRYRLTDCISLHTSRAGGKCQFTRAKGLIGRNEDILWFEHNGTRDFLHPLSVEGICIDGLADYQLCRTDSTSFEMYAEVSDNADKEYIRVQISQQIDNILLEKQLDYINYNIKFVRQILPDPVTGKKRLIISEKATKEEFV